MIEVYNDCKDKEETLPQPQLKLRVVDKNICIEAVDDNGKCLAIIWVGSLTGNATFYECAKGGIEYNQHSTDWAEWDEDGKFIKLK